MNVMVKRLVKMNIVIGVVLLVAGLTLGAHHAVAQEAGDGHPAAAAAVAAPPSAQAWAFVAAALATGLGSIAAGMAVSSVGSAAMGAVAEKPELMGKSLIYVALAEGIAIYGLLISIIILAKV